MNENAKRVFGTKEWAKYNQNCCKGCQHDCRYCVPPGTEISTPDGNVNIEELKEDDKVIGFNNGEKTIEIIAEMYRRKYVGQMVKITTEDGKTLLLTPNHPVITEDGQQVCAEKLHVGEGIIVE